LRIMNQNRANTESTIELCSDAENGANRPAYITGADPAATVRILLQSRESLLFYLAPDQWTANVQIAADLKSVVSAVDFVVRNHLHGMDVIMHFDNPVHDLRLPLNY